MWCYHRLFRYLSVFGNNKANDLVTELLPKTVISFVVFTMKEKRFLLFPNHLCLPYSIPKSFALLLAFHSFRHTFATLQVELGTDIYTVQNMLGHANVTTTEIYARHADAKSKEASQKLKINLYCLSLMPRQIRNQVKIRTQIKRTK